MLGVGRYINNVSSAGFSFLALAYDFAVAFQNVNFVFPIVSVKRRIPFRLKFKEAHGKAGCSIVLRN
jgi:hypothetical protein